MKSRIFVIILSIFTIHFCSLKSSRSKIEIKNDAHSPETTGTQPKKENIFQSGIASWYGKKFHGRRTANGEIFDMYKLTAAHNTLPFNTIIEVKNIENKIKVIVRINDRGPFIKNRIIDLSYKAAKKLNMDEAGTAKVNIFIIKSLNKIKNSEIYVHKEKQNTKTVYYYLQAGAFSNKENSIKLLKRVRTILQELKFEIYFKNGFYKIISRKINSRAKAEKYKTTLNNFDIEAFIKEYT